MARESEKVQIQSENYNTKSKAYFSKTMDMLKSNAMQKLRQKDIDF